MSKDNLLEILQNNGDLNDVKSNSIQELRRENNMTLDEGIKYCLEVAEHNEYLHKRGYAGGCNSHDCLERAIIHRQLAEWLIEFKELKDIIKQIDDIFDKTRFK